MFKKIFYIGLILIFSFTLTACDKKKAIILLNKDQITKQTILNNDVIFQEKRKVHYIFISQKPIESKYIRVRIMKMADKANYYRTSLVFADDYRLKKDEIYYYDDYFVLETPGYYSIIVYDRDYLKKPLAKADFQIVENYDYIKK